MAQVNHPSNLLDRLVRLERELAEVRKKVGISSATISRGGLTVQEGGFLRVRDPQGDELFYVGALSNAPLPDGTAQQATIIRDDAGTARFYIWDPDPESNDYRQFVAICDYAGNIVISDDVNAGKGLARPWLPVPLYPLFGMTASEVVGYATLDAADLTGGPVIWEGRATISHPWITVYGTWGQASGSNDTTYRLFVDGTEVGSWSPGFETTTRGPFDVSDYVGSDWVSVQLTATSSGDGLVAVQLYGCYLQQS